MKNSAGKIVLALLLTVASAVAAETNDLPRVSVERLLSDEVYDNPVRLEALVTDAFPDEVDPRFVYFTLDCDGVPALASVHLRNRPQGKALTLVGRKVELRGTMRNTSSIVSRAFLGRMLNVNSPDDITPLGDRVDVFDVPELDSTDGIRPEHLRDQGMRRSGGRSCRI